MAHDTNDPATSEQDALAKLRDLIKDIRVAMVITTDEHGDLHTRPMYAQQAEMDGDLTRKTELDKQREIAQKRTNTLSEANQKKKEEEAAKAAAATKK